MQHSSVNGRKINPEKHRSAGYDAGKSAGYRAFFQGSNDASCPYDFSTYPTWCTGYHAGFDEEQGALRAAQP